MLALLCCIGLFVYVGLFVYECLLSFKLWCAVGVNLSGGKTRDGGSVVGASVFYNDVAALDANSNKQRSSSQSSLDRLDQELKVWPTCMIK